jgi:DmsE family decaheme c-type cytochrome
MKTRILSGGLAIAAALVWASAAGGAPQGAAGGQGPTAACADCHADQAKAFGANPHGRAWFLLTKDGSPNGVCESCHGNGTKHMEAGGDKALINTMKGAAAVETCVACHEKRTNEYRSFRNSVHANQPAVNCGTCHSVHGAPWKNRSLLAKKELETCTGCHQTQAGTLKDKPFTHHVGRGGLECSSCHDPHGRGPSALKLTVEGELPCLNCHKEKKGPFAFEHVTQTAGNCISCHEPHGSNNPKMLKRSTVAQLCIECHSNLGTKNLGTQAPAQHSTYSARWSNCTTCHTAVHGSNRSPSLLK